MTGAAMMSPAPLLLDSHNPSSPLDWLWVIVVWSLVAVPAAAAVAAVGYAVVRSLRRRSSSVDE